MNHFKLNDPFIHTLAEEYLAGTSLTDLSRKYDYGVSSIRKALVANGYLTPKASRHTPEVRKAIADRYVNTHLSMADVAKEAGCSQTTVHTCVIEFYGPDFKSKFTKPKRSKPKKHKENNMDAVILLWKEGKGVNEIAASLGVIPATVKKHIRAAGLDYKTCPECGAKHTRKGSRCQECSIFYKDKGKYKITREDFNLLKEQQNHKCAICGEQTDLVIDHDHSTGEIRGLLCNACNKAIGFMRDDRSRLKKAIAYLS